MSLVQSDTAMKLEMKLSVLLYEQTVTNDEIKCVDEIKSCKCTCLKIDIVLFKNHYKNHYKKEKSRTNELF